MLIGAHTNKTFNISKTAKVLDTTSKFGYAGAKAAASLLKKEAPLLG